MTEKNLKFDSLWVLDKCLSIRLERGGEYGDLKLYKKDVVTLIASEYRGGPGENGRKEEASASSKDPAKAPNEYEGAALLKYRVNGRAKYLPIPHIVAKPDIYGQ
ncbi:hypothetical protein [Rufibacter roseolus]|uniref:hypothetical protein n=1 Tax=Rufibacter roseolus TaxID=2817375 RepID=UPI001B31058A|nr:hypothetical protein [Rufibacter roseolus]